MKKLACKRGYTLVEMLCVLALAALLGVLLVTGVRFGTAYAAKAAAHSEARLLLSSLSAAVKEELRYAGPVRGTGADFTYESPSQGPQTRLCTDGNGYAVLTSPAGTKELVSRGIYTRGARAALEIVFDPETGIFTVTLQILNGESLLEEARFQVRRLNFVAEEETAYGISATG